VNVRPPSGILSRKVTLRDTFGEVALEANIAESQLAEHRLLCPALYPDTGMTVMPI
jgi:hypothetical protein